MSKIKLVDLFYALVSFHENPQRPEHKREAVTLQAYKNKISICCEFLHESKLIKIDANDFNKSVAELYFTWLLSRYKNNYSIRCVEFVGKTLKHGESKDLILRNPLTGYKLKRNNPSPPDYFKPEEIIAWENYKPEDEEEFHASNLAVLQMHTGFDFGDFGTVIREHKKNFRGIDLLMKPRQKNGNEAIIPLTEKADAILEYYDYKLKVISNPEYNKCIKKISIKIGTNPNITSKGLRKIFFMDQLNNKGRALAAVSKMGGHKRIQTTETTYAWVNANLIVNELNK